MESINLWRVSMSLFLFLSCYALFWYVAGWNAALACILQPPPRRPRWDLSRRIYAALAALLRAVAVALFGGPPRDGGATPAPAVAEVRIVAPHPPVEAIIDRKVEGSDERVVPAPSPWWARGASVETSP